MTCLDRRFWFFAATWSTAFFSWATLSEALDPRSQAALQQSTVAFRQGAPLKVLQLLSPVYGRWSVEDANAADQWLEGVGMPSTLEMLLESRLQLATHGRKRVKPAPGHAERLGILEVLAQRVTRRVDHRNNHPALQSPPVMPADFVEYRRFSEDLRYLKLELEGAASIAAFAEQLAGPLRSTKAKARLTETQVAMVQRDYSQLADQFQGWSQELDTRQLQLRISRIRDAASVLRLSESVRERFLAAHAIASDAEQVLKELTALERIKPPANASASDSLDPKVAHQEVTALVEASQGELGDMPLKARLLEEGIFWWLRGRYGVGPIQIGRLKPPPRDFHAQTMLNMPLSPLTLRAGVVQSQPWKPLYPRRVHYMWQQDNRGIRTREHTSALQEQVTQVHDDVQLEVTRTVRSGCGGLIQINEVVPDYSYKIVQPVYENGSIIYNKPEDVYRQVGYLEYNEALRRFDQLLPLLSPDELKAVEEIVESDSRLVIETNLSRAAGNAGALAEAPKQINDDFRRHGFKWVIALARLEVAGVVAGLTELPNPFVNARTTAYELPAYQELVVDAFRFFHLTTPLPAIWDQVMGRGATTLLAFHRRQTMTLQLGEATSQLKLDPAQRAALTTAVAGSLAIRNELDAEVRLRTRMSQGVVEGDTIRRKSDDADGVNLKVRDK